jgi:hypothetical protein
MNLIHEFTTSESRVALYETENHPEKFLVLFDWDGTIYKHNYITYRDALERLRSNISQLEIETN